jgi:hypothetical protein
MASGNQNAGFSPPAESSPIPYGIFKVPSGTGTSLPGGEPLPSDANGILNFKIEVNGWA